MVREILIAKPLVNFGVIEINMFVYIFQQNRCPMGQNFSLCGDILQARYNFRSCRQLLYDAVMVAWRRMAGKELPLPET